MATYDRIQEALQLIVCEVRRLKTDVVCGVLAL